MKLNRLENNSDIYHELSRNDIYNQNRYLIISRGDILVVCHHNRQYNSQG